MISLEGILTWQLIRIWRVGKIRERLRISLTELGQELVQLFLPGELRIFNKLLSNKLLVEKEGTSLNDRTEVYATNRHWLQPLLGNG